MFCALEGSGVVIRMFIVILKEVPERDKERLRLCLLERVFVSSYKAIMRRIKNVCLQKEYTRSPFVNTTVRRLCAVVFLPTEVAEAVDLIEQEMSNVEFICSGKKTEVDDLDTLFVRNGTSNNGSIRLEGTFSTTSF